jgi:hypothetical protein
MMIETATAYPAIDTQTTVADLAKSLQSALDINSAQQRIISEQKNKIDNAKVLIFEAYEVDDFSEDRVEAIAEALEVSLTKEVDVMIHVTFSGTVDVPLGFDIEGDLENYIDFEATASGYGRVDIECDLFTDGVDVNVVER